jgi:hypothetical protein
LYPETGRVSFGGLYMGSYASLYISSFEVYSCKSYVSPSLMTLFREYDREQLSLTDEDGEVREIFRYINRVGSIKLRLNIMGFDLTNTINEFTINNDSHYTVEYGNEDWHEVLLEGYSFENWLRAMKIIVSSKRQYDFMLKKELKTSDDPILNHILEEHEDGDSFFGFECSDIRYVIRGLLELFNDEDHFYIDYSELVDAGYYSGEDKICELSLQSLADNYIANEKIIILSEGSSDITIIKRTMEYLYPDVVGFYSFMDFNQSNAAGSASSLVTYIKAFIGSGIRNRIIALFDNDTAAEEAITALNKVNIPSNIKVLRYPYLEQYTEYPTIGPHGIGFTNINGLACSIEMYLGYDILVSDELDYPTKYIPIQWKGYSQGLKKYQGEILNKEQIHKKYLKFLDDLNEHPELKERHDWEGLNAIIVMIFNAFNR